MGGGSSKPRGKKNEPAPPPPQDFGSLHTETEEEQTAPDFDRLVFTDTPLDRPNETTAQAEGDTEDEESLLREQQQMQKQQAMTVAATSGDAANAADWQVQMAMDTIAATVVFNEITAQDSYEAFDVDEDGRLTLVDLNTAVNTLRLGLSQEAVKELFDALDPGRQGYISLGLWVDAINAADARSVLVLRGLVAVSEDDVAIVRESNSTPPPADLARAPIRTYEQARLDNATVQPSATRQTPQVSPRQPALATKMSNNGNNDAAPANTSMILGTQATPPVETRADVAVVPGSSAVGQQEATTRRKVLASEVANQGEVEDHTDGEQATMREEEWIIVTKAKVALEEAKDTMSRLNNEEVPIATHPLPRDTNGAEYSYAQAHDRFAQNAAENAAGTGILDQSAGSFSKYAGIAIKLALDLKVAGDVGSPTRAAFQRELSQDLANASGVLPASAFHIKGMSPGMSPGSVIADVNFFSTDQGPDPLDVAEELEEQATDTNSPLRAGVITRFTESITQISVPMVSQVEHTLGTISPEKFETSVRIFSGDELDSHTMRVPSHELDSLDSHTIFTLTPLLPEPQQQMEQQMEQGPDAVDNSSAALDEAGLEQGPASSLSAVRQVAENGAVTSAAVTALSVKPTAAQSFTTAAQSQVAQAESVDCSDVRRPVVGDSGKVLLGQENHSTLEESTKEKRNRPTLRPLPKSSKSKWKSKDPANPAQATSDAAPDVKRELCGLETGGGGGNVNAAPHENQVSAAEKELLILKKSHKTLLDKQETLLDRVQMLEVKNLISLPHKASRKNARVLTSDARVLTSESLSQAALQKSQTLPKSTSQISEDTSEKRPVARESSSSSLFRFQEAQGDLTPAQVEAIRMWMARSVTESSKAEQREASQSKEKQREASCHTSCHTSQPSKSPQVPALLQQAHESQPMPVQQPLLSDEYRLRVGANRSMDEGSVTMQATMKATVQASYGTEASFTSSLPTHARRADSNSHAAPQVVSAKPRCAERRSDWEEEVARLQRLQARMGQVPYNHAPASSARNEDEEVERREVRREEARREAWSSNSNGKLATPRSVGSLPSRAPSVAPSHFGDRVSVSVVGVGERVARGAERVPTTLADTTPLEEASKRQRDHSERLALRAQRYSSATVALRSASPQRRADNNNSVPNDKSMPNVISMPNVSNQQSIDQITSAHDTNAQAVHEPPKSKVEPAFWEVNDKPPTEGAEGRGIDVMKENGEGRRLLPWERGAVRLTPDGMSGYQIGHQKSAAIKIQALARGKQDRKQVDTIKEEHMEAAKAEAETKGPEEKKRARARVLDQIERKKNMEEQLVEDLLAKGGVGTGSMGIEEQWLVDLKKSHNTQGPGEQNLLSASHLRSASYPALSLRLDTSVSSAAEKKQSGGELVVEWGREGCVELEAVYGCAGVTGKGLCHFLESREVVFPAASACVMISAEGQQQRLCRHHSHEVTCLTVHPNARLIASASRSTSSLAAEPLEIVLWDSTTQTRFATLNPGHASGVGHLCFSRDDYCAASSSCCSSSSMPSQKGAEETSASQNKTRGASPQKSRESFLQQSKGVEKEGWGVSWASGGARQRKEDPFMRGGWADGGRYLVSVGTDTFHSIVLWDLGLACSKVALVYGARDPINAVTFGAASQTVVTCASTHIKFWTLPSTSNTAPIPPFGKKTPWSQLKGRANAPLRAADAGAGADGGLLVGWKGTMPLSYAQLDRCMAPSTASEVVLTSALLSCSGLVTGSKEGVVYLWDEERRETVKSESVHAHTGPVLHLAVWGGDGMVSGGQDGCVILWKCGERATFGHVSYGHITQLNKVYVNVLDTATHLLSHPPATVAHEAHAHLHDDGVTHGVTGAAASEAVAAGEAVAIHSLSCLRDEILVGTRSAQMLILDASAVRPTQHDTRHDRARESRAAAACVKQHKMGWSEQLKAAQAAKNSGTHDASNDGGRHWSEQLKAAQAAKNSAKEPIDTKFLGSMGGGGGGREGGPSSPSKAGGATRQNIEPISVRLLADGVGAGGPGFLSTHVSGWGSELFVKVLFVAHNGQARLHKNSQAQGLSVLADCKVSAVAFLPVPLPLPQTEKEEGLEETVDPLLEQARGLLQKVGATSPKKPPSSSSKSRKEKEREFELLRRRQAIAAQGGEFAVFALGMDKGVVKVLRETASSSNSASSKITADQVSYDVMCTLNLQELAEDRQNDGGGGKSNNQWMPPVPPATSAEGARGGRHMKLGAVTTIAFEKRMWDEVRGTCRLAVGTADGRVLVCEAVKEGHGVKLSPSSKWSVAILPAPPGLAHGQQGGRVRALDWSRCGRYLRACGACGEDSSPKDARAAEMGRGLKEVNSWIRVWSVGAGGAAWEKGAALALAEGGGTQIFLHPLHLALVRAVEWCSGSCLERDSLFDLLRSLISHGPELGAESLGKSGVGSSVFFDSRLDSRLSTSSPPSSTCVARDATGSVVVVGCSDGLISLMRTVTQPDGSAQVQRRSFFAHDEAVGGVCFLGDRHFLSWGVRQQFVLLWKIV